MARSKCISTHADNPACSQSVSGLIVSLSPLYYCFIVFRELNPTECSHKFATEQEAAPNAYQSVWSVHEVTKILLKRYGATSSDGSF